MSPTTAMRAGRSQVFQKSRKRSRGAVAMTPAISRGSCFGKSVVAKADFIRASGTRRRIELRVRFSQRMTPRFF
jgi:hypothetical protein